MDTSKDYIKQCDCSEIQSLENHRKSPSIGSWYAYTYYKKVVAIDVIDAWFDGHKYRGQLIWLPTQDQIQEMIPHEDRIHPFLIKFFYFLVNKIGIDVSGFTTAEQLWLAFYMYEKYENVWDKNKWRPIKD